MDFEISNTDGLSRHGQLSFDRGTVQTPVFMPVGTYGTVKAMTPEELQEIGAEIILGNTFHLMLRPGVEIIDRHKNGCLDRSTVNAELYRGHLALCTYRDAIRR